MAHGQMLFISLDAWDVSPFLSVRVTSSLQVQVEPIGRYKSIGIGLSPLHLHGQGRTLHWPPAGIGDVRQRPQIEIKFDYAVLL